MIGIRRIDGDAWDIFGVMATLDSWPIGIDEPKVEIFGASFGLCNNSLNPTLFVDEQKYSAASAFNRMDNPVLTPTPAQAQKTVKLIDKFACF